MPLIQGFEDAGDFTVTERLKTSIHVNLVFYLIVGSVGLFGLILLIVMSKKWLVSFCFLCSNLNCFFYDIWFALLFVDFIMLQVLHAYSGV